MKQRIVTTGFEGSRLVSRRKKRLKVVGSVFEAPKISVRLPFESTCYIILIVSLISGMGHAHRPFFGELKARRKSNE